MADLAHALRLRCGNSKFVDVAYIVRAESVDPEFYNILVKGP
jgi:hypothetical protein